MSRSRSEWHLDRADQNFLLRTLKIFPSLESQLDGVMWLSAAVLYALWRGKRHSGTAADLEEGVEIFEAGVRQHLSDLLARDRANRIED